MMRTRRTGVILSLLLALGCQRQPGTRAERADPVPPEGKTTALPARPESASESRYRTNAWDFGIVSPGTEVRHRYTITNHGTSAWTVKHVAPSCSCTIGEFSSRTVKPSESTSLELAYRAGNLDGPVFQAVMIEFAEKEAPLFQLEMRGEIRSPLSPAPSIADFGRVSAGMRLRRALELRNYSDQDVTITKIQSPDWLRTEHQPAESKEQNHRPRQTWKITVHADVSKFKAGSQAPTLVIHTNSAKLGPVIVPVNLQLRPAIETVPNDLDFRIVPAGGTAQQALMLELSPEFGDLTEKDLVLTHNLGEELEIQVFKMASQNRFRVIGVFRPKQARGSVTGELEIKTPGKTAPPLRVPIAAIVR